MAFNIVLNEGQQKALNDIAASIIMRRHHLLTGFAGSGKTTLLQKLASELKADGTSFVLTAPTHKAVEVLSRKLRAAGIEAECRTIHSLLSLRPGRPINDKITFERSKHAKAVTQSVIVIDEASMCSLSLMHHIERWLAGRAVIFSGDPAQLPPVGEVESPAFSVMPASHLDTIVRQAEGNPILGAAHIIRQSQGGRADWTWFQQAKNGNQGVFVPGVNATSWMERGFRSDAFAEDPDTFRYLCWRNERVAQINRQVQRWLHGNVTELFVPGEMALIRSPLVIDDEIVLSTNQEVLVEEIDQDEYFDVPVWHVHVRKDDDEVVEAYIPRDMNFYQGRLSEKAREAKETGDWQSFHDFKSYFVQAQSVYALTIHNSQGSTFKHVFLDVPDIRGDQKNLLEMQQLLYVGATRPTDTLILMGDPPR